MKIRQKVCNEILAWVGKIIIVMSEEKIIILGWRNQEWLMKVAFWPQFNG